MRPDEIINIDPVVHAPIRLAVLSVLMAVDNASFAFLKESTAASDGNLSTHLSKLEEKGLVAIEKTYKGKKPLTLCSITEKGRVAFLNYIGQLESFIKVQKSAANKAE